MFIFEERTISLTYLSNLLKHFFTTCNMQGSVILHFHYTHFHHKNKIVNAIQGHKPLVLDSKICLQSAFAINVLALFRIN